MKEGYIATNKITLSSEKIVEKIQSLVLTKLNKNLSDCTAVEAHNAIATAVVDELCSLNWPRSEQAHEKSKEVLYLSAEFLIGRAVFNNLVCLGIYDQVKALLAQKGFAIEKLEEVEDAALGSGGLGRLAACFLDSAATLKLPFKGYGIYYKFGLFKQAIENGFQVEYADDWTRFGDCWSVTREELNVLVEFKDETVMAVAHDIPIIGFKNGHICTLRLLEARAVNNFNLNLFNKGDFDGAFKSHLRAQSISSVIYPADETEQGKILRLKQQYFFCSASVQDVLKSYRKNFGPNFDKFAEHKFFQINDTHPTLAIVELIRLLCEQEGLQFKQAFEIAKNSFAYTNHTVMAEALEKWSLSLLEKVVPKLVPYISQLQKKLELELSAKQFSAEVLADVSIVQGDIVNMANLAVYCSKTTNGVAQIHTEILKNRVLKNWFSIFPQRFQNKTNGITQRRWLLLANERLAKFITKLLNSNEWTTHLTHLKKLEQFSQKVEVLTELAKIKQENHFELASYLNRTRGLKIDPNTIFDVQVKRLHEYKRQFLNILAILHLYFKIEEGSLTNFHPTTFIFGAKAAPSYERAKNIIKLINSVAELIKNSERARKLINVVFVENYNVSCAEKLVAAANVSEQISTAGTEASGTSNMKFMLNGAVTLGTFDGANVEIVQEAGAQNNYIFGNTVEQIEQLKSTYNPKKIYENDYEIKRVLDALDGSLFGTDGELYFKELKNSILEGASWHKPDQYFLLADFHSFIEAKLKVAHDFGSTLEFSKKCLFNIANAGKFSSDRTVSEYAKDIWQTEQVRF